MLDVRIVGKDGDAVNISPNGELATAPLRYNEVVSLELGTINTAENFFLPLSGQQFVVTNVYAYGDKEVAANSNAVVDIYEAVDDNTLTVSKSILRFEIGQNEFQAFQQINLLVNPNRFINAKTDDEDIHLNIFGFYIPKL